MTKKTYVCNFCRTEFTKPEEFDAVIFGVYWSGKTHLAHKECWACENHICATCLNAIHVVAPEIRQRNANG